MSLSAVVRRVGTCCMAIKGINGLLLEVFVATLV